MFLSLVSILMFMEKREFHSSSESLIALWNEWELRILVLLSLLLQIILIGLGNQRKYNTGNKIAVLLWLAYLSADSVATIALGILARSQNSCTTESLDSDYVIMAFWAPFLLLHLGGPDTITAYSLEDNELWLRHFLGLIVEAGVAFYVFFRSLKPTQLNFVAIPIFIAGLIKYGERTWALRSASSQEFKNSLLSRPDPGPNYAKFMDDYTLKELEGYNLLFTEMEYELCTSTNEKSNNAQDAETLKVAYDFFMTYKRRLFADLILSVQDLQRSLSVFQSEEIRLDGGLKAFNIVEIELEFMYDVLFTKATVVYSSWGRVLRAISLSSSIAALVAFCIIDWQAYSQVNVVISLLLLIGAIGLEIYTDIVMLFSDWTTLWLRDNSNQLLKFIYKAVSNFNSTDGKQRWSNSIAQYNLIGACLKDQPLLAKCCEFLNISWAYKLMGKLRNDPQVHVENDLKKLIFEQIRGKSKDIDSDAKMRKKIYNSRGCLVLLNYNCLRDNFLEELHWSVDAVEFDQSILLWHIATDLCYYDDENSGNFENLVPDASDHCRLRSKVSRLLSDYLMHILVKCPSMLPEGIGQIRFHDSEAEATNFFQDRKPKNEKDACIKLLQVNTKIPPSAVKGDRSKSVLFNACRIAKLLQNLENEEDWDVRKKWDMISDVWVEMLLYAASHCRWNHHAQQLWRGGELLTHVWLLMAQFGIMEKLQISRGRIKRILFLPAGPHHCCLKWLSTLVHRNFSSEENDQYFLFVPQI